LGLIGLFAEIIQANSAQGHDLLDNRLAVAIMARICALMKMKITSIIAASDVRIIC